MITVLDVSAAIHIVLKKEKIKHFKKYYEKSNWVIAPELFIPEITNVLWKYYKANIFSHDECRQFASDGISLVDAFFESKDLWTEVLGESIRYNHSAYDLFYMVLARRNNAILLSNDRDLIKLCNKLKIENCG
jgi:predicted nucleic acid-binding protein